MKRRLLYRRESSAKEVPRRDAEMKPSAQRIVDMRRSGIREVMDLAASRPDVLHLEVGEPNFATPDHVLEAAARAAVDGFTK